MSQSPLGRYKHSWWGLHAASSMSCVQHLGLARDVDMTLRAAPSATRQLAAIGYFLCVRVAAGFQHPSRGFTILTYRCRGTAALACNGGKMVLRRMALPWGFGHRRTYLLKLGNLRSKSENYTDDLWCSENLRNFVKSLLPIQKPRLCKLRFAPQTFAPRLTTLCCMADTKNTSVGSFFTSVSALESTSSALALKPS